MAPATSDKLPTWLRQLISYALFGCIAVGVDVLVYEALTDVLGLYPLVSNVASASVGITTSFFLNRRFTFKASDRPGRRYLMFLAVGTTGMLVQEVIIWALLVHTTASNLAAKLVAVVSAGILQFLLNRGVTFGRLFDKV